jgi:hypothetical protein
MEPACEGNHRYGGEESSWRRRAQDVGREGRLQLHWNFRDWTCGESVVFTRRLSWTDEEGQPISMLWSHNSQEFVTAHGYSPVGAPQPYSICVWR